METTTDINGQTYRLGKLGALPQFHISRRLSPLLAVAGTSLAGLKLSLDTDVSEFASILEPVTEIIAKMPEEDVNYILFTCLNVVARKQGEQWAPITRTGQLMFEDIDMPTMLQIVFGVLKNNLGNFMKGLGGAEPSPSS